MLSRYGGKPCVELHGEDKILFDLVVGCERLLCVTFEHRRRTSNVKSVVEWAAMNGDGIVWARL